MPEYSLKDAKVSTAYDNPAGEPGSFHSDIVDYSAYIISSETSKPVYRFYVSIGLDPDFGEKWSICACLDNVNSETGDIEMGGWDAYETYEEDSWDVPCIEETLSQLQTALEEAGVGELGLPTQKSQIIEMFNPLIEARQAYRAAQQTALAKAASGNQH